MSKSPLVNMIKGVAVGMAAGAVVGYAGKSLWCAKNITPGVSHPPYPIYRPSRLSRRTSFPRRDSATIHDRRSIHVAQRQFMAAAFSCRKAAIHSCADAG